MLCSNDIDINYNDSEALRWTYENNQCKMVNLLLKNGADVLMINKCINFNFDEDSEINNVIKSYGFKTDPNVHFGINHNYGCTKDYTSATDSY